jgi:hypothetical protein
MIFMTKAALVEDEDVERLIQGGGQDELVGIRAVDGLNTEVFGIRRREARPLLENESDDSSS